MFKIALSVLVLIFSFNSLAVTPSEHAAAQLVVAYSATPIESRVQAVRYFETQFQRENDQRDVGQILQDWRQSGSHAADVRDFDVSDADLETNIVMMGYCELLDMMLIGLDIPECLNIGNPKNRPDRQK